MSSEKHLTREELVMESNETTQSQGDQSEFKFSRWLFYRNRLRFAIFRRDNFTCQYCGRSVKSGIELTIDHVTPLSLGGNYEPSNLFADDLLSDIEREILENPRALFADWPIQTWKAVAL